MKIYKKILLTHDGSPLSSLAIEHASELAKMYSSTVIVLQVVDSVTRMVAAINTSAMAFETQEIYESIFKSEKENAENNLKEIHKKLQKAGIKRVTTTILEGDARDKIVSVAKKEACDLIIMSTHGRSGIRRALLGSVAEDVVRHAPCPVLLIREKK